MLKFFLELHEHDGIGDEALDSALRVLRPSGKDMDVEEASYKLRQEEELKEIKEESYEEPWCMPGGGHLPNRYPTHQNILKGYPFYSIDGDDVGTSLLNLNR